MAALYLWFSPRITQENCPFFLHSKPFSTKSRAGNNMQLFVIPSVSVSLSKYFCTDLHMCVFSFFQFADESFFVDLKETLIKCSKSYNLQTICKSKTLLFWVQICSLAQDIFWQVQSHTDKQVPGQLLLSAFFWIVSNQLTWQQVDFNQVDETTHIYFKDIDDTFKKVLYNMTVNCFC